MSMSPASPASLTAPLSRDDRRARTTELFAELDRLTPGDEARAEELWEALVLANAQVARALARRFRGRGLDLDDLEQTAYLALVRAVRQYDTGMGHDFLAYAVPTITGELKRHFRDSAWTIRVPRRIQETQRRLERGGAAPAVGESYGNARVESLAELLGVSVDDVDAALSARGCFAPASLDTAIGAGMTGRLGDLIPADEPAQDAVDARMTLQPLWEGMPPRDRQVLHLRYVEERSQREIGDELGVSQVQVSRLLTRIHRDLRRRLTAMAEAS
jgi:RNA polymerase sigma-B factor